MRRLWDPSAIEQALAEFRTLGRAAFLGKQGYGKARDYFLSHESRLYDSKAIVGVAHGYEFPELGPLRSSEFNSIRERVPISRPSSSTRSRSPTSTLDAAKTILGLGAPLRKAGLITRYARDAADCRLA
jgi:hypothetical protein